jgi:alpha,alpha-trehalase
MIDPAAKIPPILHGYDTLRQAIALSLSLLLVAVIPVSAGTSSDENPSGEAETGRGLTPILKYISTGWDTLTRSLSDCATIVDPKLSATPVLYLPADFPVPAAIEKAQQQCKFEVKHLEKVIHHPGELDATTINPHGLLYLENSYVVPGGRFNEMYGWDSYFIIRGLVRDGRVELARGMVENFFFEIEHYGNILNANRTYYLSRMQPPFLTSMILSVYEAEKAAGHEDRAWLTRAYGFAAKDHDMWTREPHLAGDTGLARYFDLGDGPSPESVKDEAGHYRQVAADFIRTAELEKKYIVRQTPGHSTAKVYGSQYSLEVCDAPGASGKPGCDTSELISLDADFYKGDRSMRESGFDISFRFGPYGAGTHHFAPVCLNSLLYKTEKDLEHISGILGRKEDESAWRTKAKERGEKIQKYLWNAQKGMFYDYDFVAKKLSSYDYVTTFYPLWARIATPEQAKELVKNIAVFERPGGLVMSPYETGGQWDFPYAWAPNQLMAVEGLRKYGFNADADRASYSFLSTVAENFRRDGTIREKYNAVTRSSEVAVSAGYNLNVIGFGWTNGVFLNFLHDLPKEFVEKLAKEQETAAASH